LLFNGVHCNDKWPTAYNFWKYLLVHNIKFEKQWVNFSFLTSAGPVKGTEFIYEM